MPKSDGSRYRSLELYEYYNEYCQGMGFRPLSGQQYYKRLKQMVTNGELALDIRLSRMSAGQGYEGKFAASGHPVEKFLDEPEANLLWVAGRADRQEGTAA